MIAYPLQVNDTITRVLQAGRGGEAIVLLHGTGERADRWARNLDTLGAAGHRVYAVDLPGHGFATKGGGPDYSVPGYVRFLRGFLDAVGIERAALVGTSLGGHVVARFAVEHPQRVRALVLNGSMGLVPIGAEARGRIQRGASNQSRDGVVEKLRRVIFDPALITEDMIEEEYRINNSPGAQPAFEALGAYIGNRLDDDVIGEGLAALAGRIPTLLIWGAEDKTVPLAVGETAQKLLGGAPLAVIAGAAHTSYYEQPEAFNGVLLDFMAGKRGEPAPAGVSYR